MLSARISQERGVRRTIVIKTISSMVGRFGFSKCSWLSEVNPRCGGHRSRPTNINRLVVEAEVPRDGPTIILFHS